MIIGAQAPSPQPGPSHPSGSAADGEQQQQQAAPESAALEALYLQSVAAAVARAAAAGAGAADPTRAPGGSASGAGSDEDSDEESEDEDGLEAEEAQLVVSTVFEASRALLSLGLAPVLGVSWAATRFDPEAFSTAAALAAAPVAFAAVLLFAPWAGAPTTEQLAAMPRALAAAALPS
ncbi:hypothetical protein MNEG_16657 [Monoraphidium neglectum]|uniref:Uncharacterized protein n=1 Tax=Monoraphidium neglectum TaxID=145388 RepID=A0A0D2ITF2_9CHLO|nr:hypothetical protein MNEG_16657 [Monoraphidium neglectum]KIY91307.1 hypothetical protein MNEG_16657 [Monoraphidium neglectum]|eukprot:XP_013890327.1 hypothetical protein MNEG_16657 [Monoraphidium neglectum]